MIEKQHLGKIMTSGEMSGPKTGIQEVERRDSDESADFEHSCDEGESKKVFDEKNVIPEPVSQPYVSVKSIQVLTLHPSW